MTIECYFSSCPHHSIHYGDEGPFCDELECIAPKDKLEQYSRERMAQLQAMGVQSRHDEIVASQPAEIGLTTNQNDGEIVNQTPATNTPPTTLYPHSKVVEFFAKPDFKEFVGARRIGQAFYDFMGFKPAEQTISVNVKLDKIYEADGANAKALIESYADFSS